MDLNALTLDIFTLLMQQNTINPPGNEQNGAICLKPFFDAEGIPYEIQDLGNNRANFIAEFGTGNKTLEFCGHLDTVPCTGNWRHEKLAASEENGLIYGRGACDMKSGIAAMCAAALSLKKDVSPLSGKIRLTFVADEEHANLGMHAFQAAYPPADYAILGEPTDLHVAIAHRGVARFYIDLNGHARHAALQATEDDAVIISARAILAINELNKKLSCLTHPILPSPSIVVTQVEGYEKDNVVPGRVRMLTDFRILPGMSEENAKHLIRQALEKAGISNYDLSKRFYMPGGEIDADNPFVRLCCESAAVINERNENPVAFDASCEQCFLTAAGTTTVILGPGSLKQAHTVDEYVEKKQLFRAAECYRSIAIALLK